MVYLDSVVVVYLVERHADFFPVAQSRLEALGEAGASLFVSDLTRTECLARPSDALGPALRRLFEAFFGSGLVTVLPLPRPVFDRAADIASACRLKPLDSLHLATAIDAGCERFLTNDRRLSRCGDIAVDQLAGPPA